MEIWQPGLTLAYFESGSGEIDDHRIGDVRTVHHPVPYHSRAGFEVNDDDFRQPGDLNGFAVRPSGRYRAEEHARGISGIGIVKGDAAFRGRVIGSVVDQDGEGNPARRSMLPGRGNIDRISLSSRFLLYHYSSPSVCHDNLG